MAKTKTSKTGKQQKKIVPVKPYKKSDGTKVKKSSLLYGVQREIAASRNRY